MARAIFYRDAAQMFQPMDYVPQIFQFVVLFPFVNDEFYLPSFLQKIIQKPIHLTLAGGVDVGQFNINFKRFCEEGWQVLFQVLPKRPKKFQAIFGEAYAAQHKPVIGRAEAYFGGMEGGGEVKGHFPQRYSFRAFFSGARYRGPRTNFEPGV